LQGVQQDRVYFAPGLKENIAAADKFEEDLLKKIDAYIAAEGLEAPPETIERLTDANTAAEMLWLDLKKAGVSTIIWATGYRIDYSLVRAPVFDEFGYPVADRGVSRQPGLYFAGFGWLPYRKSGLLLGIAEIASHIAEHACTR
jgi:putative flavoprotein involved in K+ transport